MRIAVLFGAGSIEHRCPVDGRAGLQHAALLERPCTIVHHLPDVGNVVRLRHAVGSPAVQTDEDDVFVLDGFGPRAATGSQQEGECEEQMLHVVSR